jgi:excisionase family DNA binding protein
MPELFMNREEAARTLRISLRTLDTLIGQGQIVIRRIGRRVLIPTEEVRRFAEPKPSRPRLFEGETTAAVVRPE